MRTYCITDRTLLNVLWWPELEVQKGGDIYIYIYMYVYTYIYRHMYAYTCMADSFCYTTETNITL